MPSTRPRYFLPATLLILLAGFVLRVWGAAHNSLWLDEILAYRYADVPVEKLIHILLVNGAQVPLYFILQFLFPTDNDLLLRLPSLLFGLIGIALIIGVAYDLYRNANLALAAGGLLAANPYHILYSRTARPYALVFVVALLVSFFFLKLLRGQRTRSIWIGFLLASAAAYLTHFYTLMLPLAEFILLGIYGSPSREDRRFFWRWCGAQVLASLPLVYWMFRRLNTSEVAIGVTWIPNPTLQDIPLALANLGVGYDHTTLWYFIPALIALMIGLLFGAVYALRHRANPADLWWLLLITATILPSFLVSLLHPIFLDRYLMICLPAVLLLMLRGWTLLPRRVWTYALVGLVTLTGVIHVAHKIDIDDYTRQEWRAVAPYIAQRYQAGDTFLDDNPFALICAEYYYPRPAEISDHTVSLLDLRAGTPTSRLWVVYLNPREDIHRQGKMPEFDPFQPGQSEISDWLIDHRDQVIDLREFGGVTVLLVDLNHVSLR